MIVALTMTVLSNLKFVKIFSYIYDYIIFKTNDLIYVLHCWTNTVLKDPLLNSVR